MLHLLIGRAGTMSSPHPASDLVLLLAALSSTAPSCPSDQACVLITLPRGIQDPALICMLRCVRPFIRTMPSWYSCPRQGPLPEMGEKHFRAQPLPVAPPLHKNIADKSDLLPTQECSFCRSYICYGKVYHSNLLLSSAHHGLHWQRVHSAAECCPHRWSPPIPQTPSLVSGHSWAAAGDGRRRGRKNCPRLRASFC